MKNSIRRRNTIRLYAPIIHLPPYCVKRTVRTKTTVANTAPFRKPIQNKLEPPIVHLSFLDHTVQIFEVVLNSPVQMYKREATALS